MLKIGEAVTIQYSKEDAEVPNEGWASVPERVIVPTSVPRTMNIRALDVTELSDEEQARVEELVQEYAEYMERHIAQAFSFADFCEHTTGEPALCEKWRTFKPGKINVVVDAKDFV